ncbi:16S rRNA (guanine(966)-N(2))-methyltransferase RsmD [Aldersonia sp. NBC_00410]|uniref:16S rRNA (guanine(966)-N(2))-methyltransferase RsmD n=1 Tax=Aldersonia sp. NBC_00410 TaxID=2975954 RepID=UPI00225BF44C|nr:16S rRNA (guanine(966)-N(2))-methyltransferase RsmD [Aldersonia sp. NBC_00410]MCX5046152.1 16S rRNA (guanine(966)-N(2))-methyltransferase RsmD [Aldersonia sp. NBC_00410]
MTRIVAGIARGRRLQVPPAGTRPTSDRVREALFSALVSRVDLTGAVVLDLYAGSGALGLEALSRGAAHALHVEFNRRSVGVLRENVAALDLPGAQVRAATVASVLRERAPRAFDVVFSDPPYALADEVIASDLAALVANGWLHADSVVALERSSRSPATVWPQGLVPEPPRKYGETRIELAVFESDGAATV